MRRILFTLIGKPRFSDKSTRSVTNRYSRARYSFDGITRECSVFVVSLIEHLRASNELPDRVVFLGTTGSAWAALAELIDDPPESLWDQLLGWETAEPASIEAPSFRQTLEELSKALEVAMRVEVVCQGIDSLATAVQQSDLFRSLRHHLQDGDRVVADVTHSLGHQRILLAQTLVAMETLMDVQVDALYSGAFELQKDEVAPAVRLDGVLRTVRVDRALANARRTGDPSDLVRVIPDGHPMRAPIQGVADAWRLQQPTSLRLKAGVAVGALRAMPEAERDELRGIDEFLEKLLDELKGSVAAQQFQSARAAIVRGDLLRAALSAREACISVACVADGKSLNDVTFREGKGPGARDWLENPHKATSVRFDGVTFDAWPTIQQMRNALAHGTPPKARTLSAIFEQGPGKVAALLDRLVQALESELRITEPRAFR